MGLRADSLGPVRREQLWQEWESNPPGQLMRLLTKPLVYPATVGPEGLEPSLYRLKGGCAAANTLNQ